MANDAMDTPQKPAPDDSGSRPAGDWPEADWAWAPYEPDQQRPWTLERAGHLYRRAALGANWAQLQLALSAGCRLTLDKLLRPPPEALSFNHTYDQYEASAAGSDSADALRAWWLRRMIESPDPLRECLTLFWHNHFAVSNGEVKNGRAMLHYVQMLRRNALGDFRLLLGEMVQSPAVLLGLQAAANRRAQPNENLVRPLFESFALGPQVASDEDVHQAARAFTGLFVFQGRRREIPREHDEGVKDILGQTGNFGRADVVRILLEQDAASRWIVRRLYRWLISEIDDPPADLIEPLAKDFAEDYDILRLTERMLRSNLFFSDRAYRRRVKSPVEFACHIIKGLEATVPTSRLGDQLARLGQNLYHPPTVKGWAGGRHWIHSAALTGRANLAAALLGEEKAYADKLDPWHLAQKYLFADEKSAGQFLLKLFVQDDLDPSTRETLLQGQDANPADSPSERIRRLAGRIVSLPEFQLA
ncbi:MAG: DUF1800 domain-containing protein [Sedimentisphaerales bacterium]|nr:DUF1800 domain-containing protein [Sedimentisphaerales bacterium]